MDQIALIIIKDHYWDSIHVQASLMMIIKILFMSKHPWWWLMQFDPCSNILDYVDWDSVNVQASFMMVIEIWSASKHPLWWLLQFYQWPSILDDVDWDSIDAQASLAHSCRELKMFSDFYITLNIGQKGCERNKNDIYSTVSGVVSEIGLWSYEHARH